MRFLFALLLVAAVSVAASAGDNPDVYAYITFDPDGSEDECDSSGTPYTTVSAYVCLANVTGGMSTVSFMLTDPTVECPGVMATKSFTNLLPGGQVLGDPFVAPGVTCASTECEYGIVVVGRIDCFYLGGACCFELLDHVEYPRWVVDCQEPGQVDYYCVQAHGTINGGSCNTPTEYPCPGTPADLTVQKTGPDGPIELGADVSYQAITNNAGPGDAHGVVFTDYLPPGVEFVSAVPTQGTCSEAGGVVECDLGVIPVGGSVTIEITGSVSDISIQNRAEVSGNEADPDLSGNTAACVTHLECPQSGVPDGSGGIGTAIVYQNRPNPLNPNTVIGFSTTARAQVGLRIYSSSGRLVAVLVDQPMGPGEHQVTWDGTNDSGRRVASGVYYYKLSIDGAEVGSRKAVLLR
jgi:uncharacterized repeat protein (TIGR01451 family)